MKVFIQGKGHVTLTKADFLSSGGEGEIFVKNQTAFKIYTDQKKMIPPGKIQELSVISNKNVIKPEDILLNEKNDPIGYSMRFVKDTYSLCQLFNKSFKDRNNLDNNKVLNLVKNLRSLVQSIHDAKILIVDLNELNFLVSQNFSDIYAIDCDSYETKNFRATAIMDNIRDRHSPNLVFNEGTDWFSFGIIAFNLICGINPYKGTHLLIKTLDERMLQNVSVFNKNVSVPKCVTSFDIIPNALKSWFKAVFEEGKRLPPPIDFDQAVIIVQYVQKNAAGSNIFQIKELEEFIGNIINVYYDYNKTVLTDKNLSINKITDNIPTNAHIISLPRQNSILAAWVNNGKIQLRNSLYKIDIPFDFDINELMVYQNRLYGKADNSIVEIKLNELGNNKIIPSVNIVAQILPHASKIYDGCVIQNLLGAIYISIFPKTSEHYQFHIKELDNYKIIDAKFDNNVLMIVGQNRNNKKYDKLIIRFDALLDSSYDLRVSNDINYQELNFVTIDSGNCVHIVDEEKLEIFSNRKGSNSIKEIDDKVITTDMRLHKYSGGILFSRQSKLYSLKMI